MNKMLLIQLAAKKNNHCTPTEIYMCANTARIEMYSAFDAFMLFSSPYRFSKTLEQRFFFNDHLQA